MNFGASLGWMGAGIAGFEVDFGYAPNFFERTTGDDNFEYGDSNVTTLMGNVVLGAPIGGQTGLGIRPYAVGGVGIIKSRIDNAEQLFDVDKSSWASTSVRRDCLPVRPVRHPRRRALLPLAAGQKGWRPRHRPRELQFWSRAPVARPSGF